MDAHTAHAQGPHLQSGVVGLVARFNGTNDDAVLWIRHLDNIAMSFNLTAAQKLQIARLRLEGPASTWLMAHRFDTWETFESAFCARFSEPRESLYQQYYNLYQRDDESVREYNDRFLFLAERLDKTNHEDPELIQFYLRGLKSEFNHLITLNPFTNLSEIMNHARHLEDRHLQFQFRKGGHFDDRPHFYDHTAAYTGGYMADQYRSDVPHPNDRHVRFSTDDRRPSASRYAYYDDRRDREGNRPRFVSDNNKAFGGRPPNVKPNTYDRYRDQRRESSYAPPRDYQVDYKARDTGYAAPPRDAYSSHNGRRPPPPASAPAPPLASKASRPAPDVDALTREIQNLQIKVAQMRRGGNGAGPSNLHAVVCEMVDEEDTFDYQQEEYYEEECYEDAEAYAADMDVMMKRRAEGPAERLPTRRFAFSPQDTAPSTPSPFPARPAAGTPAAASSPVAKPVRTPPVRRPADRPDHRDMPPPNPLERAQPPAMYTSPTDVTSATLKKGAEMARKAAVINVDLLREPIYGPAVKCAAAGYLTDDPTLLQKAEHLAKKAQSLSRRDGVTFGNVNPVVDAHNPANRADTGPAPMVALAEGRGTQRASQNLSKPIYAANSSPSSGKYEICRTVVTIDDSPMNAVVDTGASNTMISDSIVRRLELTKQVRPANQRFNNADGRVATVQGLIPNLPITVGNLTISIPAYVVKASDSYDLLLGNDMLAALNAVVDIRRRKLFYRIDKNTIGNVPITLGGPSRASFTAEAVKEEPASPQEEVISALTMELDPQPHEPITYDGNLLPKDKPISGRMDIDPNMLFSAFDAAAPHWSNPKKEAYPPPPALKNCDSGLAPMDYCPKEAPTTESFATLTRQGTPPVYLKDILYNYSQPVKDAMRGETSFNPARIVHHVREALAAMGRHDPDDLIVCMALYLKLHYKDKQYVPGHAFTECSWAAACTVDDIEDALNEWNEEVPMVAMQHLTMNGSDYGFEYVSYPDLLDRYCVWDTDLTRLYNSLRKNTALPLFPDFPSNQYRNLDAYHYLGFFRHARHASLVQTGISFCKDDFDDFPGFELEATRPFEPDMLPRQQSLYNFQYDSYDTWRYKLSFDHPKYYKSFPRISVSSIAQYTPMEQILGGNLTIEDCVTIVDDLVHNLIPTELATGRCFGWAAALYGCVFNGHYLKWAESLGRRWERDGSTYPMIIADRLFNELGPVHYIDGAGLYFGNMDTGFLSAYPLPLSEIPEAHYYLNKGVKISDRKTREFYAPAVLKFVQRQYKLLLAELWDKHRDPWSASLHALFSEPTVGAKRKFPFQVERVAACSGSTILSSFAQHQLHYPQPHLIEAFTAEVHHDDAMVIDGDDSFALAPKRARPGIESEDEGSFSDWMAPPFWTDCVPMSIFMMEMASDDEGPDEHGPQADDMSDADSEGPALLDLRQDSECPSWYDSEDTDSYTSDDSFDDAQGGGHPSYVHPASLAPTTSSDDDYPAFLLSDAAVAAPSSDATNDDDDYPGDAPPPHADFYHPGRGHIIGMNPNTDATPDPWAQVVVGDTLPPAERHEIMSLLEDNAEAFAFAADQLGFTDLVAHTIDTGDARPIRQRPYRLSPRERELEQKEVERMLQLGVIRHSNSPWASPVVLVPKPDGTIRYCIDFRRLNAVTRKDVYPLPLIDDILDSLGSAKYFSKVDLKAGYWQVLMDEDSIAKTAFITASGLYEWVRLPMGLCNSPGTFQRLMNAVLRPIIGRCCFVYLDDVIIYSTSLEQHLEDLAELLALLKEANLTVHPGKSQFGMQELKFLGHVVNQYGNKPDPDKTAAMDLYPVPRCLRHVREFLGLTGYYRRFIQNYSAIAAPLTYLLGDLKPKKGKKGDADENLVPAPAVKGRFIWLDKQQEAFDKLKHALLSAPILRRPDFERPFILYTDWAPRTIAAILAQEDDKGREYVVCYGSHKLSGPELNYSATEGECLALIWAVRKYRHYLLGRPFKVVTDHVALKWLLTTSQLTSRLARWSLALMEYQPFEIEHRPGRNHSNVDAFTRLSEDEDWGPEDEQQHDNALIDSLGGNAYTAGLSAHSVSVLGDNPTQATICEGRGTSTTPDTTLDTHEGDETASLEADQAPFPILMVEPAGDGQIHALPDKKEGWPYGATTKLNIDNDVPFHIVIEGNIGAGKTTAVEAVSQALQISCIREEVNTWSPFLTAYYSRLGSPETRPGHAADLSAHATALQMRAMLSAPTKNMVPVQCIAERSLATNVFIQTMSHEILMPHHSKALRDLFERLLPDTPKPIVVFYLKASVDTCFARAQKRGRPGEAAYLTRNYLELLDIEYEQLFRYSSPGFPAKIFSDTLVIPIDAERPPAEVHDDIIDKLQRLAECGFFHRRARRHMTQPLPLTPPATAETDTHTGSQPPPPSPAHNADIDSTTGTFGSTGAERPLDGLMAELDDDITTEEELEAPRPPATLRQRLLGGWYRLGQPDARPPAPAQAVSLAPRPVPSPGEGVTSRPAKRDRSPSIDPDLPCEVCQDPTDDSKMILCDGCNRGYHLYCLQPRLHRVPPDEWYCRTCKGKDPVVPPAERTISTEQPSAKAVPSPVQRALPFSPPARAAPQTDPTPAAIPHQQATFITIDDSEEDKKKDEEGKDKEKDKEDKEKDLFDDDEAMTYLKHHTLPSFPPDTPKEERDRAIKRIRKRTNLYFYILEYDTIYKKADKKHTVPRQVPPPDKREGILASLHDDMSHSGHTKLRELVSQRFWWYNMTADVKAYVDNCEACKRKKAEFKQQPELQPLPPVPIFHRVGVDLIGPFPVSNRGNKYVVVAVEYYTRWVEARALPDKTSDHVAAFFLEEIIGRYGCPQECLTDNGGEFQGAFKRQLNQYGIAHRHTTPYHPQANGLVERNNQTLQVALTRRAVEEPKKWDTFLPHILLGMRNTRQATTKFSPFFLMYGREATLPCQMLNPASGSTVPAADPPTELELTVHPLALEQRSKEMNDIAAQVLSNTLKAQEKQKESYRKRKNISDAPALTMPVGSLVFMRKRRKANKLEPDVEGPYKLAEYCPPATGETVHRAVLQDAHGAQWFVGVHELAPYTVTPTPPVAKSNPTTSHE